MLVLGTRYYSAAAYAVVLRRLGCSSCFSLYFSTLPHLLWIRHGVALPERQLELEA